MTRRTRNSRIASIPLAVAMVVAMCLVCCGGSSLSHARNIYRTERIFHLPRAPGETCAQSWGRLQPDELDQEALRGRTAVRPTDLPPNSFVELKEGACIITLYSRSLAPR